MVGHSLVNSVLEVCSPRIPHWLCEAVPFDWLTEGGERRSLKLPGSRLEAVSWVEPSA